MEIYINERVSGVDTKKRKRKNHKKKRMTKELKEYQ